MTRERRVAARNTRVSSEGEVTTKWGRYIARPDLIKAPLNLPFSEGRKRRYAEAINALSETYYGPADLLGKQVFPLPSEQAEIEAKFGDPASVTERAARRKMFNNYRILSTEVAKFNNPLVGLVDYTNYVLRQYVPDYKVNIDTHPGLETHLAEARSTAEKLYLKDGKSRFKGILDDTQAKLLVYVIAPMHDMLKSLGTDAAQTVLDHQAITAAFIREQFTEGRYVRFGNEEPYRLTQEDTEFIAMVIGNHENIGDLRGRTNNISSQSPLDRAQALFFVVDTLSGAFDYDDYEDKFSIKPDALAERFTDLYERHAAHADLTDGKIFMPEWGVTSIQDLIATFDVLQDRGLQIEKLNGKTIAEVLIDSGQTAIQYARQEDQIRHESGNHNVYDDSQTSRITNAAEQLERFALVERISSSFDSYLAGRGQINPKQIARLVVERAWGLGPKVNQEYLASVGIDIPLETFMEYVELAPAVEIGNMHHELWKRDFFKNHPGEVDRWREMLADGENAVWVASMLQYERAHGSLPGYLRRKNDGSGKYEVNILQMTFSELPPSRQDENIKSALVAIDSVKREIAAGKESELVRYAQALAIAIEEGNFEALNATDVQEVHELGNANHERWLRDNKDNWNYLTKQSYYDMLKIARGQYNDLSADVRREVIEGARDDKAFMDSVRSRVQREEVTSEELESALTEYAQGMVIETIKHGIVLPITVLPMLSEVSQGMVVEDLKFVWFAIRQELEDEALKSSVQK